MSPPLKPPPGAGVADQPLDAFSLCHVGILSHLEALGQLPALLERLRLLPVQATT